MCCRYWTDKSPELRAIVEEMNRSPLVERWQRTTAITLEGEVRPADVAPVIASNKAGARAVFPMKWGFTGQTRLMNARVETAAQKPTFKDAWAAHRCIVPAAGYFEWEHYTDARGKRRTGEKYRICPKDGRLAWLCGLYRIETGLPVFVILTREPGEALRALHDRMPLMLPGAYVNDWIRPDADPYEIVKYAVTDMDFVKAEG